METRSPAVAEPPPGGLGLTALNPAFRASGHEMLDQVRAECPVRRDEGLGGWYLTRYADVRGVVTDRSLWRDPDKAGAAAGVYHAMKDATPNPDFGPAEREAARNSPIIFMDDPHHARVRAPIMQALYKRIAASRPAIEAIVEARLGALAGASGFDIIADYAIPIPIDAIAWLLGVDTADLPRFRAWSEAAIMIFHPARSDEETRAMDGANQGFLDYLTHALTVRRRAPGDDLISDLAVLQAGGAPISDAEICHNCIGLLVAGNLTTTDLIANAVWLFLTHPRELAKLKADPRLINAAVEEALRLESPVDVTGRVASRDMRVGGCPVAEAEVLYVSLKAANHDPEVFDDPHRFDITRPHVPHVAFGGGAHICVGAPLARLEAQVALAALFARFPALALADPAAVPLRRTLPFFNGFERLDLVTG
ncbi:MAG TPA: cytochrome P450 [Caulobacteraceae bacterium]|nr:cytochrome P450 [Caulobacteraceae bacterium]